MAITYYFRVGDLDTIETPGGIYREIADEEGLAYQYLNARAEWIFDAGLATHFFGPDFTTDLVKVSLDAAEKAIKAWPARIASKG